MRKWCTLGDVPTLSRERILMANDLLDAQDEAAEDDAEEQRRQREKNR
jgi:hypothetical protein